MKLMKMIPLSLCLLVLVAVGSGQTPSQRSERDRLGLIGPVKTMKWESTFFRQSGNDWVEGARHFFIEVTYDLAGNQIKQEGDWPMGSGINTYAACQPKYVEDEKGRPVEEYEVCGKSEKLVRKYVYEDDSHGNWTKKTTLVPAETSGEFRKFSIQYHTLVYFD